MLCPTLRPTWLAPALVAALFVAATDSVTAAEEGLSPKAALERFKLAEGFQLKLFAAEPTIAQPVAMQFDRRGRMWVIQYRQYPHPAGLKVVKVDNYLRTIYDRVPEPPPAGPRGADRITILEDTDGDGRHDTAKDFLDGLNLATGMALGHGGVFVVQSPYLLFYPDRDENDVPDGDPEVLLTGFGMEDSHAFANSLQWGPDGWLYGAQGSTVTAHIRGVTFQQGIWRYHPRTKAFELFAEGGGNTWGLDFDRHGNAIAGTNHGGKAMLHQVQGAYYEKNFGKHGELQNPYAFGYFGHVPHQDFKGGHVTIGGIVYQADAFPQHLRNQYLAANVLSNALYWHHIEPSGSSFTNRFGGDLLTTDDQWFRPVDCAVGPDGSLYIADWYDQRANHVDPRDDWHKTSGRIYKLEYQGTRPAKELDLRKLASIELVALLAHPNDWYSRQARLLLAERNDSRVAPALDELIFEYEDEQLALECVWARYVSLGIDEPLALRLLTHKSADIRTWMVRLLGDEKQVSPRVAERFVELARTDPSNAVRSQLACTAKRLPAADGLPIVAELLRHSDDATDPHIPLLLWWAIEDKAESDRGEVLELLARSEIWSAPITQQFIQERLARRYAAAKEADFAACARLLERATSPTDVERIVRGMEKGLEGRQQDAVPEALAPALARLWSEHSPPSPNVVRLAIRLGSREARERSLTVATDRNATQADRLAMIDILGQVGTPESLPALLKLLDADEPGAVRAKALAALARFSDPQIATAVLALYPKLNDSLKTQARSLLCGREPWAKALLDEVEQGRIKPADVPADSLQQIALHGSAELNEVMEKHWGKVVQATPDEKRAQVHGIRVSLKLAKGDPIHGKELFTKHCGTCHTLFGEGNKIGPDLTGADRKNELFLLTNIVDPSAVIRKEFFMYNVLLTDGRLLSGLIADSSPSAVTILDAKNQRTTVATADVEEMNPSQQSIMPEKILDPLTAQQVRDLMSYLQSEAPAKALTSTESP